MHVAPIESCIRTLHHLRLKVATGVASDTLDLGDGTGPPAGGHATLVQGQCLYILEKDLLVVVVSERGDGRGGGGEETGGGGGEGQYCWREETAAL